MDDWSSFVYMGNGSNEQWHWASSEDQGLSFTQPNEVEEPRLKRLEKRRSDLRCLSEAKLFQSSWLMRAPCSTDRDRSKP